MRQPGDTTIITDIVVVDSVQGKLRSTFSEEQDDMGFGKIAAFLFALTCILNSCTTADIKKQSFLKTDRYTASIFLKALRLTPDQLARACANGIEVLCIDALAVSQKVSLKQKDAQMQNYCRAGYSSACLYLAGTSKDKACALKDMRGCAKRPEWLTRSAPLSCSNNNALSKQTDRQKSAQYLYINKEETRASIKALTPLIAHCYERKLYGGQTDWLKALRGKILVNIKMVKPSLRPQKVAIECSDMVDPEVDKCLEQVLSTVEMTFSKSAPHGGIALIRYPFTFSNTDQNVDQKHTHEN